MSCLLSAFGLGLLRGLAFDRPEPEPRKRRRHLKLVQVHAQERPECVQPGAAVAPVSTPESWFEPSLFEVPELMPVAPATIIAPAEAPLAPVPAADEAYWVEQLAPWVRMHARGTRRRAATRGLELEDLVAEGNLAIVLALRSGRFRDGRASLRSWLMTEAKFGVWKATDPHRHLQADTSGREEAELEDWQWPAAPQVDFERRELLRQVGEQLETLPAREREAVASYLEEQPYDPKGRWVEYARKQAVLRLRKRFDLHSLPPPSFRAPAVRRTTPVRAYHRRATPPTARSSSSMTAPTPRPPSKPSCASTGSAPTSSSPTFPQEATHARD